MSQFTPANARENAAKAHEARKRNEELRQQAALAEPQIAATPPANCPPGADFVTERLPRVRKQLERLDHLMKQETDPAKLDRLAAALYRLSEQERIMSGRPLPGSYKPESNRDLSQSLFRPISDLDRPLPEQPL
jgi:hypothetical protein